MALVTIRRIKERPLQEQWDIVGWWIYQSYQFALAADPGKEDWADSFSLSLSLAIHSITHMSGRKVQVENDGTYAIKKKNLRNFRVGIWKERMMMDDGGWHLRNSKVGIWKERRTRRISGWMTSGTEWTLCRRSEREQLSCPKKAKNWWGWKGQDVFDRSIIYIFLVNIWF